MNERAHQSIWTDLGNSPFQQGYIDAGGIRTRYLSSGSPDKPLLLLLHGTGGHAEAYVRNLAAHGEHFWTVAFDFVGHGWSDKPAGNYEIPRYTAHVAAMVKAMGRDKALISGESLGGWVASDFAMRHPEMVERLVLNTAGGWTAHEKVMAYILESSMQAVENPNRELIRKRLELLMYDPASVTEDLIANRQRVYSQPGYAEVMRGILCLQHMDIRRRNMFTPEQYASITAPTLVLWTSHDPTATPEEGRQIAEMIPGAQYVVMNQCGHWPQFEDPETFNRIHIDFLLGGSPASSAN